MDFVSVVARLNKETNESQWEKPEGTDSSKEGALVPYGSNVWEIAVDPASGCTYYYCPATGDSSWDKPDESSGGIVVASSTGSGGAAAAAAGEEGGKVVPYGSNVWEIAVDPTSGCTYYYCSVTGQSSWDKPDEAAGAIVVASQDRSLSTATTDGKKMWETAVDPASGCSYYYCSATGESSWEKPKELDEVVGDNAARIDAADPLPQLVDGNAITAAPTPAATSEEWQLVPFDGTTSAYW